LKAVSNKTPSVPALERGLRLLEFVASAKTGLTFSQIAKSVALPKSSIHTLLLTLEREGYLHRSETSGRYVSGLKLADMAHTAIQGPLMVERAGHYLRSLADRTGLTVHMGTWDGRAVALIAKVDPFTSNRVATWVGKRIDFHCTSLGKCLVAYRKDLDVDRLVREYGLLRHNENTISSSGKLRQELERVRKLGHAIDDEEEELGIRCIGAPVFNEDGGVTTAISISGNTDQINDLTYAGLSKQLKDTAVALGAELGCGHGKQLQ
jgi:DNA-binding IclR family transcriptional regulator